METLALSAIAQLANALALRLVNALALQLVRPMALVPVETAGEGKARMALRSIEPASVLVPPPAMCCE